MLAAPLMRALPLLLFLTGCSLPEEPEEPPWHPTYIEPHPEYVPRHFSDAGPHDAGPWLTRSGPRLAPELSNAKGTK